jgi:nicotinamide-nucleotide amidase
MRAEIIASGTELLLGEVSDINTSFIAGQLAALGIDLYYASIVGDNYERFSEVLKQAFQRSDMVIITGGLGPTKGDITREVIAGLMGEKMELDRVLKQHITDFFSRVHLEMTDNNLKQAMLIPGAVAIPNPLGTAPGWWVEKEGKIIISLPGPPREMQPMWQKEILPRLGEKGSGVILSRTLKTWGLSEAKIDQLVGPYMSSANPTLALYAKTDGIHLRITAKSNNRQEALQLINNRESELREILKDSVWGTDQETMEDVVSHLIQDMGLSVAVAESFTGGLLTCSFSGVRESGQFFKGGLIMADTDSRRLMGIIPASDAGRADIRTASKMAALAREKFGADIGIGIDGGVQPQSDDSSLGQTFLAISLREVEHNFAQTYPARSYLLARRSVMNALYNLRKVLLDL